MQGAVERPGRRRHEIGAASLFYHIDADRDGKITAQELYAGLSDQGFKPHEIDPLFLRLDANHDESITKAEFLEGFSEFVQFQKRAALGLQDYHRDEQAATSSISNPFVDFSGHRCGDRGVGRLLHSTRQNEHLTGLKFHDNSLGTLGINKIASFVKSHHSIGMLTITGDNRVTNTGAHYLLDCVKTNRNVRGLEIEWAHDVASSLRQQIQAEVSKNRRSMANPGTKSKVFMRDVHKLQEGRTAATVQQVPAQLHSPPRRL